MGRQCATVNLWRWYGVLEVSMAKRRNPKKEKALRNQAYARKFRKKRAGSQRFFRRNSRGDEEGAESKEGSDYSAASL
jgi:hypothetical protein